MGRRSNRSIPLPPPFQLQLLAGAGGFMHLSQRNNAATKKFLIFYVTLLPNVNNLNSKPKGMPAFYIANVTKKNILSLSSKKTKQNKQANKKRQIA